MFVGSQRDVLYGIDIPTVWSYLTYTYDSTFICILYMLSSTVKYNIHTESMFSKINFNSTVFEF